MLERAFVDTHDHRALTVTRDFNFVVGRRGTGKTALFLKCEEHFASVPGTYLHYFRSEEHHSLELDGQLERLSLDYRMARATTRVAWKLALLMEVLANLSRHWKLQKTEEAEFVRAFCSQNKQLIAAPIMGRVTHLVRTIPSGTSPTGAPGHLAGAFALADLELKVKGALASLKQEAVFLFDGLDEGWTPSKTATGLVGGLAIAIADFRDKHTGVHGLLFVRDNVFRAIAALDQDFWLSSRSCSWSGA